MRTITVTTWEEFERQLVDHNISVGPDFLFRGQHQSDWSLDTTLERRKQDQMTLANYYGLIGAVQPQIEAFTNSRWEPTPTPDVIQKEGWAQEYETFSLMLTSGRVPAYSYMAYLRHHGFPSPLLDWTRSPYIAAYFAFRAADQGNVAIYVYSERDFKTWCNDEAQIHTFGRYVQTHRRHFLQQSTYTVCLKHDLTSGWRFAPHAGVFARGNTNQDILWKFTIPSTERLKVLKLLDTYNLNAFSLFESEESLMETVALRELELTTAR